MRRLAVTSLLLIFSLSTSAQVSFGLGAGFMLARRVSSEPVQVSLPGSSFIAFTQNRDDPRLSFSLYAEIPVFKKSRLKQELVIYETFNTFYYHIPDTINNTVYYQPYLSSNNIRVINYRAMITLRQIDGFRILAGPSINFNKRRDAHREPYFSDKYPEVAKFARLANDSYSRVVLAADLEVGWITKFMDLSINFQHSFTPVNRKISYEGLSYNLRSRSWQLFIRLGWRFYNSSNRKKVE